MQCTPIDAATLCVPSSKFKLVHKSKRQTLRFKFINIMNILYIINYGPRPHTGVRTLTLTLILGPYSHSGLRILILDSHSVMGH